MIHTSYCYDFCTFVQINSIQLKKRKEDQRSLIHVYPECDNTKTKCSDGEDVYRPISIFRVSFSMSYGL